MRALDCRARACGRLSEPDRALRDVDFVNARSLGQLFDRLAVAISRRQIHVRVRRRRIFAQNALDAADRFHEERPIEGRQHAHRGDDVRDRQLIDRLPMLFDADQFVGRFPLRRDERPDPPPRRRRSHGLIAKAVKHFDDEGRRRFGREMERGFRFLGRHQTGRELPRRFPFLLRAQRLHREPAEIFHQRQTQHDRDGPELADCQRHHILIRVGKTPERVVIESSSRVGDKIARQQIDARIAPPAACRNRRQLFVILPRQAPPNFLNLRPDDVMVVAEPFL